MSIPRMLIVTAVSIASGAERGTKPRKTGLHAYEITNNSVARL